MRKEDLIEHLQDEDFVIRIRPFADDDGGWSGEIDISIMAFPENPLNDEDYDSVMHFTKMMCATVPLMESEKGLRDIVHEYVINVIDNEMEIDVELEEEIGVQRTDDGNVIHLNFNTKTGGTA